LIVKLITSEENEHGGIGYRRCVATR
jgi:hypothetical protein